MATTETLIKTATDEEYDKLFKHVRQGEDMLERKHRQVGTDETSTGGKSKSELREYLAVLREAWKERKQSGGNHTTEIPDEIIDILTSVADYYDVEAKDIYNNYLEYCFELDKPYPLSKFKKTLEGAKDSLGFETGGFIRPFKLNYTDKLTYDFTVSAVIADSSTVRSPNKLKVYRLTEHNSKKDFIKEAHKAEAVLYELGASEKHILSNRAQSVGQNKLEKASKDTLLEYLWQLYDLINERLTKLGGETNGKEPENANHWA